MRDIVSAALALGLMCSSVFAADSNGPLSPGKPAGVKQAALAGRGLLIVAGVVVAATLIAVVASNNNSNGSTTTTTGTAP
jgi:hypothetical protein